MPSPAKPKWRKSRITILRKPLQTPISTNPYSVPFIDIIDKYGAKALEVSKKLRDLENKVQRIKDLSLELSASVSLIDLFNDTNVSNLAATGRFCDSLTKGAHKGITNAKNDVVFNIPDHLPLSLVQVTVLNVWPTTLASALDSRENPPTDPIPVSWRNII